MTPFLTFYTPTFRRPAALAACMASVAAQTAVEDIEHLIIADHVGIGIDGMYRRITDYAPAVHGRYVHILADDDVLASPTVVQQVEEFASQQNDPAIILVAVRKGGNDLPADNPWPPREGVIDLGCVITRADVWRQHVADYGARYEGDFDHAHALYRAGYQARWCDLRGQPFLIGAVSRGWPEGVPA